MELKLQTGSFPEDFVVFRGEIDDRRFTIRGKFIYRMLARRVMSFEILVFFVRSVSAIFKW